jgi:hypothetical protein
VNRTSTRRKFPFRLVRKAAASPACERIRFKKAHMANGRIKQRGKRMPTSKSEDAPARAVRGITFPIEWRPPLLFPHRFPALGKPKFGARVCGIGHKLQILSARHAPVCDLEGFEVHLVAGRFVVKAKIQAVRRVYGITNLNDAVIETVPPELRCCMAAGGEGGGVMRQTQWV